MNKIRILILTDEAINGNGVIGKSLSEIMSFYIRRTMVNVKITKHQIKGTQEGLNKIKSLVGTNDIIFFDYGGLCVIPGGAGDTMRGFWNRAFEEIINEAPSRRWFCISSIAIYDHTDQKRLEDLGVEFMKAHQMTNTGLYLLSQELGNTKKSKTFQPPQQGRKEKESEKKERKRI